MKINYIISMDKVLEKYYEYLKYELNYSDNTISDYKLHILKYKEYLDKNHLNYLSIKKDDVIDMLKYLDTLKLTNRTISNILSALRNFYNYLLDEKYIKTNIFKVVSNPKLDKKLPNFLSIEDLHKIIESISIDTPLDLRNRLIIEMLYATGVRVSELVNIKISDINFNEQSIRIMGKGRKERIVFYGEYAKDILDKYLDIRNNSNEYLIQNNKGNKITSRGIEKIIDKVVEKACINNNVSPHTFRHTFATHLLNSGCEIKSVQELLGHSSLNTTEVYTHITSDYLKSEYRKNMPRR